jgi:hypothetical protein
VGFEGQVARHGEVAVAGGIARLLHVDADLLNDFLFVGRERALDGGQVLLGGAKQLVGVAAGVELLVGR